MQQSGIIADCLIEFMRVRYFLSIMFYIRSIVLVVCAAGAIDGKFQWRRYLLDNGPIGYGSGGASPGGDPLHQGGNGIKNMQFQQGQCVTLKSPCRCSMNYAVDIGCLRCNCGQSYYTASTQQLSTSKAWVPSTSKYPTTTAPPVAMSTTITSPKPTTTVTTIDYCDVAKQLCQANCPSGYLVDSADCTYCICKKDALAG
ncbi:uncharacterized protein LOC123541822 [Mercenaria mercenaria]|uniref:uncharacterized protein LOC123541822 n=1 Tax=Mercenaria mercenaria TaxID=6596 RepID=UPI00234F9D08|nr:uncharacterized protein LOC123541822 [Mercenaria mercenaria]